MAAGADDVAAYFEAPGARVRARVIACVASFYEDHAPPARGARTRSAAAPPQVDSASLYFLSASLAMALPPR